MTMISIAERRKHILEGIRNNGFVKVAELAEELNVTQATIRKDLRFLEEKNLLYRAHGSAMPTMAPAAQTPVKEVSFETKKAAHTDLKQRIAARAIQFVEENDTIMIGPGSTMTIFAERIQPKGHLNVVTPSVTISAALGANPEITIRQLGGVLHGSSLSVHGKTAIRALNNILCSKLFFGVDGFDLEYGFTCSTVQEAELLHHMIQSASQAIVLADSSKAGQRGFGRICAIKDVDILITDAGLPEKIRRNIEAQGVNVILV